MEHQTKISAAQAVRRTQVWYMVLVFIVSMFVVRLFYLQIIRYDFYHHQALSDQFKQSIIPATRGIIEAQSANGSVPIVLNQTLYTVYADPTLIKNVDKTAQQVKTALGGDSSVYKKSMQQQTRYAILAKKVNVAQEQKLLSYKLPGVGAQAQDYRIYPQGTLAAQVLGFVDDAGHGQYGIEQALNSSLAGKPGELKAVTDINGVPLVASGKNVQKPATAGDNITLTINVAMQKQLEQILQQGVQHAKAPSGSALIMDPKTGAVEAMANFPSYDPASFYNVSDPSIFNNAAVSQPLEIGSVMKTLTTSAALDLGVIKPDTTYYDPAQWTIDGFTIRNVEEDGGPGVKSIANLLNLSLNTGATWMLMQMGGGQINQKARDTWHDYLVNHFQFGKLTGIEQGYEAQGTIPDPNNGYALNLTYANTSFGQGMTATAIQTGAALSSVLNGGTYYQPHLVSQTIDANGQVTQVKPKIVKNHVVGSQVGPQLTSLMQYVLQQHRPDPAFDQSMYTVGGKTGTAQIAQPGGGYYENEFNGTYVGFVGGNSVQHVIVVFVNQPKIAGYAGTTAAQPIFVGLAHMLLDDGYVTPKI